MPMRLTELDAYAALVARLQAKYRARDAAVSALLDAGDLAGSIARAEKMRARLAEALRMPGPPIIAEGRVAKRLEWDFYDIENVIIEEKNGQRVPMDLYLPKSGAAPWPVVVVSLGHWPEGRRMAENRILCANLAAQGIAAATYDPLCQGERAPYGREEFERLFGPAPEDIRAVNLHMQPGNLAYLLGENLGAQFLQNSKWVVDYLCTRPDIDRGRIGAAGQSGGGTQTTWLAALDDRICCYCPIQCLTKQAMTLTENGIGDCEQSILGISAQDGFDYADVLWAAFPKPCRINAASEDFFLLAGVRQLESELTRLYELGGAKESFSVRVSPGGHWPGLETRISVYDFFCRQFLGRPGPMQEADLTTPAPEQLVCFEHGRQGARALDAWRPALREAQDRRPKTPEELKLRLAQHFGASAGPCTVQPLWQEGGWKHELLRTPDGRTAACRLLTRGSRTLCVVIADPAEPLDELRAVDTDLLSLLPWGMHSAFAKRRAGYDDETMLFNASAVLGESILRGRFEQLTAAVGRMDEANGYQKILFLGQGPAAVLALLGAVLLPKAGGALLVRTQLSFDALFDVGFYLLAETAVEPGLLRLCDLPDLARLAGRVRAVDPLDAAGQPMVPGKTPPISAIYTENSWRAAAQWLEEERC